VGTALRAFAHPTLAAGIDSATPPAYFSQVASRSLPLGHPVNQHWGENAELLAQETSVNDHQGANASP
jgi:hypothetical protein